MPMFVLSYADACMTIPVCHLSSISSGRLSWIVETLFYMLHSFQHVAENRNLSYRLLPTACAATRRCAMRCEQLRRGVRARRPLYRPPSGGSCGRSSWGHHPGAPRTAPLLRTLFCPRTLLYFLLSLSLSLVVVVVLLVSVLLSLLLLLLLSLSSCFLTSFSALGADLLHRPATLLFLRIPSYG